MSNQLQNSGSVSEPPVIFNKISSGTEKQPDAGMISVFRGDDLRQIFSQICFFFNAITLN